MGVRKAMNLDTGEIEYFENEEELKKRQKQLQELGQELTPIDESDMTEKQKETLKVSPFDNRSILGKKRIEENRVLNGNKRKKHRKSKKG